MIQYIKSPGKAQAVYRGRLRARKGGFFRIDYSYPEKQTVFCGRKGLFWYYPSDHIVYEIKGRPLTSRGIAPLDEFRQTQRFTLENKGWSFYNLFTVADRFTVRDKITGLRTDLWLDSSKKTLLEKVVKDRRGYRILREVYSDFVKSGSFSLPSQVRVLVRTPAGSVENLTLYSNIKTDIITDDEIFVPDLPADTKWRKTDEPAFR